MPVTTLKTEESPTDFWDDPKIVARFSQREPDKKLVALTKQIDLQDKKVLDLGCAAGRNTTYLYQQGITVYAVDNSVNMLKESQQKLESLGLKNAQDYLCKTTIDDLSMFKDETFDLIVALGIYHQVASPEILEAALKETTRVLKQGGLCLVSSFAPGTRLLSSTRSLTLLSAPDLEAYFARYELYPEQPSELIESRKGEERRVSVSALFRKA